VDGWTTASQNVITEDRFHDDTVWEAYIQWYTSRTRSRVMDSGNILLDADMEQRWWTTGSSRW
jgi:hypothetical protein